MGWLQDILKENRLAVASWPEWKRRAGMSDEMSEAETLVAEVGRLRAENAQLKADIVKDEELYRLEIKALISVRGQMERGVDIMVTEINQLKAELAEAKAREARLLEALKSIGQIRFLLGNDPRLNPAYEMGAIAQHALKEAGT